MKILNWGLLSTANINRKLIPAIRASKRGALVAVASRNLAQAESYAKQWGIPLAFGDYQSMLDSGKVDAVYISLPNHMHAEWSIRAMLAGVHVLCEKPFALTLEEVDQMISTSQQTGIVLAEAFMYRHHPQTKIIGEWAHTGRLGEVTLFRGCFNFDISNRENVRLIGEFGGGCLWDVGVYPVSFAQYIYSEPPFRVFGSQWLGDSGVDETFIGQMQYSSGSLAQIASSFRTPYYTFAEVIGTEGRIEIKRPFTNMDDDENSTYFFPAKGEPEVIPIPKKELYLGEVEDMHAAIIDHETPFLSLQETRDHVRTTLALYESARTDTPIELS